MCYSSGMKVYEGAELLREKLKAMGVEASTDECVDMLIGSFIEGLTLTA